MTLLVFLWIGALTLIGLSFVGVAVLGVRRVLQRGRAKMTARVRQHLLTRLVRGEAHGDLSEAVCIAARCEMLALLVVQVCATVRGHLRDAFLERLAAAGAVDALARSLRRGSRMERVRAAEAMVAFADHGAAPHLSAAWRDRAPRVRFAALYASTEIGEGPSFDDALTLAAASAGKKRIAASELLRRLAARRPVEAADWMRRVDLASALRRSMIEGLGEAAPSPGVVAILIDAALDADLEVRASAISALAACKATSGHAVILAALGDPAWPVRVRAIAAASQLRLGDARPRLTRMLDDEDWWVRHRASEALGLLGGRAARGAVA